MQNKQWKRAWTNLLCAVLLAATALVTAGCANSSDPGPSSQLEGPTIVADGAVLGEGAQQFTLEVADAEGAESTFTVNTDEETVGAALLALDLIQGEEGAYGLYVKTVNGITADYDKDGVYWAFYINGAYATSGVDSTEVTDGAVYAFRVEQ